MTLTSAPSASPNYDYPTDRVGAEPSRRDLGDSCISFNRLHILRVNDVIKDPLDLETIEEDCWNTIAGILEANNSSARNHGISEEEEPVDMKPPGPTQRGGKRASVDRIGKPGGHRTQIDSAHLIE